MSTDWLLDHAFPFDEGRHFHGGPRSKVKRGLPLERETSGSSIAATFDGQRVCNGARIDGRVRGQRPAFDR